MAASAGAIRAGRAFIEMFLDKSQLERGLKQVQRRLATFGRTLQLAGGALMGFGAAALAPMMATVKAASDLQETMSKFEVVFGQQSAAVKAWADTFAGEVGRSKQQIASFMAGTQDLFVPLGFDPTAARGLSEQITKLAVDLGSFNNVADEDALRDLHAALTGSGEVMKKYGVIVSEAAVRQELLNQSIDPKVATEQQKVLARLNIIMAGTSAAQGDAIRTSGGFANQMKRLWGIINDTSAAIGNAFLPILSNVVKNVGDVAARVGEWATKNTSLIISVAAGAAGVTALGAALVGLGIAASSVAAILGLVTTVVGALLSPVGLLVAGLTGLVAWIGSSTGAFDDLAESAGGLREMFGDAFEGIKQAISAGDLGLAAQIAFKAVEIAWLETLAKLKEFWHGFIDGLEFPFGGGSVRLMARVNGELVDPAVARAQADMQQLLQRSAAAAAGPSTDSGSAFGTALAPGMDGWIDPNATGGGLGGLLGGLSQQAGNIQRAARSAVNNAALAGTFSSEFGRMFFNRGNDPTVNELQEHTRILRRIEKNKRVYT